MAAARLADRLTDAGILNEIVAPLYGDDFNDDLRRGVRAADYGRASGLVTEDAAPVPAVDEPSAATLSAEIEAAAEALTNPPDVAALGALLGRLVLAKLDRCRSGRCWRG